MTDSWKTNKELKRDDSNSRVSLFFGFNMKRFLVIPFVMLFLVLFGCQEKVQKHESAFKQEDLDKLKLTKRCPKCNLRKSDLSKTDLSKADLSKADLSKANLRWAYLWHADLSQVDLSQANLSDADLYGADLTGANLSGADLRKAQLWSANLSEADLREADLSQADLRFSDLSGADLSFTDLSGVNLSRADLTNTKLDGAILCHTTNWPEEDNSGCEEQKQDKKQKHESAFKQEDLDKLDGTTFGDYQYEGTKNVKWTNAHTLEDFNIFEPNLICVPPKIGYKYEVKYSKIDSIPKAYFEIKFSKQFDVGHKLSKSDWDDPNFYIYIVGSVDLKNGSCEIINRFSASVDLLVLKGELIHEVIGLLEMDNSEKWLVFSTTGYETVGTRAYSLKKDLTVDRNNFIVGRDYGS